MLAVALTLALLLALASRRYWRWRALRAEREAEEWKQLWRVEWVSSKLARRMNTAPRWGVADHG